MELQAVTGQLYIVDGTPQSGTAVPGLLAQAAPSKTARGRERDFLFVHLTLTGQPQETAVLAQDLLDAISNHYYQAGGSVTAALRQSINKANTLLLRLNLSSTGALREGAITCAVLHHGELFLVQAGESLALLGHNFGIERLPARAPDRITPLGRTAGLDMRYYHQRLQTGDMLLLLDPRLGHVPTADFNPALVDAEAEYSLAVMSEIVGDDSARLLLMEFTDDAPSDLPEITLPGSVGAETAVSTSPASHSTLPTLRLPEQLTQPVRQIDIETSARTATSEAAMGLSRVTDWLAELVGRLRAPRRDDDQPINWIWPALIAVIIPLTVALIVSNVYLQWGDVQRMAVIKQEMAEMLGQAETEADEAVRRAYYQTMLVLAAEAETRRPGDDEINRLRQEANTALDELDGVLRLRGRLLYEFDDSVNLTAVALQDGFNGGIYTLDGGAGSVYRHDTDESYLNLVTPDPSQITQRGQIIRTFTVGDLVDIFWRPRGAAVSQDGLAILDSRGALLTYHHNFAPNVRVAPLGLASEWGTAAAVATFDERLYVLDPVQGEIWKYYPDGDGFLVNDEDRVISFDAPPGLETAVDIDIYSEDASLLVVYDSGGVRYYDTRSSRVRWDEQTLLQNGLRSSFLNPVAGELVGKGLNTSIYVADPGSGRIVEIGHSGTVLAQYRASDENGQDLFRRITDFAVARTPLRIFVVAGNQLYAATID